MDVCVLIAYIHSSFCGFLIYGSAYAPFIVFCCCLVVGASSNRVVTPMPGQVVSVTVKEGDQVGNALTLADSNYRSAIVIVAKLKSNVQLLL